MSNTIHEHMRALPAVDVVLRAPAAEELARRYGREAVADAVRQALDASRALIRAGETLPADSLEARTIVATAAKALESASRPKLRRVVNATGIILHTGLGRAVMPDAAREALGRVTGFCNLQQDLHTGQRDLREDCLRDLVRELTGAEEVLVVNNNAGATFLVLAALARGKEAVVSRGELIEIGGSFRLPDIMRESGAILREVGTTNKTHLRDYESAAGPQTGLILKAHKSNYRIIGFTKEVSIAEIAAVGHKHGVPVVDDIGSGALVGLEAYGLQHEGTVRESVAAGADIVLFSTDKLIGGPQGGMIVGRKDLLDRIRAHPLYRVLRVCKLTLGALEATLRLFKAPDLLATSHPVYRMIARTPVEMEMQAIELKRRILAARPDWDVTVSKETSFLGGGSLPEEGMPSFAVRIDPRPLAPDEAARRFRQAPTPVIPRVADGRLILDMRTTAPDEMDCILEAVACVH